MRLLVDVAGGLAAAGARLRLRAAPDSPARRIIELCGLGALEGIVIEDRDSGGPPPG